MQVTKNYGLIKQELTDAADIEQTAQNWDKVDTELKKLSDEKFDKTGGTISGAVTSNKGITVKGGTATDTINVTGNATVGGTLTLQGGATVESLTATGNVSAGSFTVGGDSTLNGKLFVDAIRAKIGSQSMNIGVNKPNAVEELLGLIVQWVSGTTPRISITHNPEKASNDKSVATTAWVKSLIATQTDYGLVRLAKEPELLVPANVEAAINPKMLYDIEDFRKTSTAYKVGDKVKCPFNFELFLECTTAGTTSSNPLDTRGVQHGQVLNDDTVRWTVRTHVRSIKGVTPDANGDVDVTTTVLKRW